MTPDYYVKEVVMDKYDPGKKVTLTVDEWGIWHAPLAGSNPGFLVQQKRLTAAAMDTVNTVRLRDARRKIAVSVRVDPRVLVEVQGRRSPDAH